RTTTDALVINPAGLSFRSIPLLDALKTYDPPIVELHMSNIHARDELHRHSIISTVSDVVICGAGAYGYIVAMLTAARLVGKVPASFGDPLSVGPAGS
ncbi:MAG: type II 3-dehydroquinate dehydratase, partial [Rhodospirillaceae bacterium]